MSFAVFQVDATPVKRLFMSIIADYDFKTSICELIDNAIDHWNFGGKKRPLIVKVFLDWDRQMITVEDNAGGVPKDQIAFLVQPGASRQIVDQELIGNFGVGGKRAGVALGSRTEVTTQHGNGVAHKFVLDDDWLSKESWNVEIEEISSFSEGTTKVRISELRQGLDGTQIDFLKRHFSEIYAKFISNDCTLLVNGEPLAPTSFEDWAYPPDYPPQVVKRKFTPSNNGEVCVSITGGLTYDRNPVTENYGVYFYCNSRLISSHLRTYEVGFHKGAAGTTHPDASLCRVVVDLHGPPELMPWTSSKSAINWSNPSFLEIRDEIIAMATRFSRISRGLKNERETSIYPFQDGHIEEISSQGKGTPKRIVELPVPRGRKKAFSQRILEQNIQVMSDAPWTRGLVEAMSFVEIVCNKRFETRNRMALIMLDSNFEIGLKEFLVHLTTKHYSDAEISKIFADRREAISTVKALVQIEEGLWQKARHYYDRRNKLIHERATVMITDNELADYRNVVEVILSELFRLDFSDH